MSNANRSWVCVVCGYVHQGDAAPEVCPICGAPDSDFEQQQEQATLLMTAPRQWYCLICGYVHDGPEPPDVCPVCAASADAFEAAETVTAGMPTAAEKRNIVIVGGGIAGVSAAEAARQAMPEAEITLYSHEPELPYYRLNLTRFLAGEIQEEALPIHSQSWYEQQRVRLVSGAEAVGIMPDAHLLQLSDGASASYDKLILACGAHAFVPPIPGAEQEGVAAVRTAEHVRALLGHVKPGTACVCIGGGILGLETAGALAERGCSVVLLEGFDYLLPRQLTREAARVLERHVLARGIKVVANAKTEAIVGDGKVRAVRLSDGQEIPADVVTITTGVRANSHLARKAGLTVNNGIVVDAHMVSSHPDILAAGDVAEYAGVCAGLWEPARQQGMTAGRTASGVAAAYGGLPRMNTLKVLGVPLFSIGVMQPEDGSFTDIIEDKDGCFYRFLFRDTHLAGAILVGNTALSGAVTSAIKDAACFSKVLAQHPSAADIRAALG